MDCGVAFCHSGCPLGNLIPEWNEFVARGDWADAPASGCTPPTTSPSSPAGSARPRARPPACSPLNTDPVTIKQVEVTIVEKAFDEGCVEPQPAAERTGSRVAVVGSGPAGLAAAQQLTRAGHAVTVFERDDRLGGLLRYGIPDFKMPKDLIDRRIEQMAAEGTEFRVNTDIGRDDVAGAARATTTRSSSPSAPWQPRELTTPGPRTGAACTRPWRTCRRATGCRPATSTTPAIDAARQARDHHRRRRHRGRLPRHGQPPGRAVGDRARPQPAPGARGPGWSTRVWPSAPSSRGSSPAHDEGVHEAWAREVVAFVGDERRARARRDGRGGRDRAGRRPARVPAGAGLAAPSCRPTWCCSRPGSSAPTCPSCSTRSASTPVPGRGTVGIDDRWQTSADGVYACGDATRGRLAGRVGDRRGTGLRGRRGRRAHRAVGAAAAGAPARRRSDALVAPPRRPAARSRRARQPQPRQPARIDTVRRARPAAGRPRCSRDRWPRRARPRCRPAHRRRRARWPSRTGTAAPRRRDGQPPGQFAPQRPAVQAAVVDGQPHRVADRRCRAAPPRTGQPWRRRARPCRARRPRRAAANSARFTDRASRTVASPARRPRTRARPPRAPAPSAARLGLGQRLEQRARAPRRSGSATTPATVAAAAKADGALGSGRPVGRAAARRCAQASDHHRSARTSSTSSTAQPAASAASSSPTTTAGPAAVARPRRRRRRRRTRPRRARSLPPRRRVRDGVGRAPRLGRVGEVEAGRDDELAVGRPTSTRLRRGWKPSRYGTACTQLGRPGRCAGVRRRWSCARA